MKPQIWLAVSAAATALTLSASPARAAPNPFWDAYHGDLVVTDVSVSYSDNILESHSDRASRSFVENAFPAELRSEFEDFAASRVLDDNHYAERLSEFLVTRDLRFRTLEHGGSLRVRLDIEVTEARINGMITGAFFGGAAFPRLGATVRIVASDSNAVLATALIMNSQSWDPHNQSAARRHGFSYNFSGTDTNFRLLAGSTEALSSNIFALLTAPGFGDERIVVSEYPRVAIRPPVFAVTVASQQE